MLKKREASRRRKREKKSSTQWSSVARSAAHFIVILFHSSTLHIRSREREMKLECLQFIHLLIHFPRRQRAARSTGRPAYQEVKVCTAASLHYVLFVISLESAVRRRVKWPCFVCAEAREKRGKQSQRRRQEREIPNANKRERGNHNNERGTIIFWQAVTYFPRFSVALFARALSCWSTFSSEITHATRLVRSSLGALSRSPHNVIQERRPPLKLCKSNAEKTKNTW